MKIIICCLILSIVFLVKAKEVCYETTIDGETFYLAYDDDDNLVYGYDECNTEWEYDGKYFITDKKGVCWWWQNCDRYLGIEKMTDKLYKQILDLLDLDEDELKQEEIGSYVLVVKEEPDDETDHWQRVENEDNTVSIQNVYLEEQGQASHVALRNQRNALRDSLRAYFARPQPSGQLEDGAKFEEN